MSSSSQKSAGWKILFILAGWGGSLFTMYCGHQLFSGSSYWWAVWPAFVWLCHLAAGVNKTDD